MSVANNISALLHEIPKDVTLIVVSKTKSKEDILQAYDTGQRDFGENYVQELCEKQASLPNDIRWHYIGHLQTNKVKYIAPFVHLIHGIDTTKLLAEVNKQGAKFNRRIDCLLQVHIAGEETKFGFDVNELRLLLRSGEWNEMKNVNVCGLMGMASNTQDEALIREEFRILKQLQNEFPSLKTMSFGMSGDYKIAIEEGSNMLRLGSVIFGERNYQK